MPRNERQATVTLGDDDLTLLQAHLRSERWRFAEASNEVMTGLLDRVEAALNGRVLLPKPTELDRVEAALDEEATD